MDYTEQAFRKAWLLGGSAPEGLVLSDRRVIIPEEKWFISDSIITGMI